MMEKERLEDFSGIATNCPRCGASSFSRWDLDRHLRVYRCPQCGDFHFERPPVPNAVFLSEGAKNPECMDMW